MQNLIKRFRRDERGAAMVEYGLLVALIAVTCLVTVTTLGQQISSALNRVVVALAPFA